MSVLQEDTAKRPEVKPALNKESVNQLVKKYGILIVLLGMILIMLCINPTFRTMQNAINIVNQISINGIIACGMTMVIITAGIDLSVGSYVAMASVTIGYVLTSTNNNVFLAVVAAVLICALGGLFNGLIVARFEIHPFAVTLATQMMGRGVAYIISDGQSFILQSDAFSQIGQGKVGGKVPICIFIFIGVAIVAHLLLGHTKFGRYIYAIGGNMKAAEASGVNKFVVRLLLYTLCSAFVGIAGVILTSRVNAGQPSIGVGYETDAIAASFIGGTSFFGGVGSIPGTVVGVIMIGVINNMMNLLNVSSYYQQIVKGAIILGAVLLDIFLTHKNKK